MLPFTDTTFARRAEDEADPREVAEGMAIRDFLAAATDLMANGWTLEDLTRAVEESLPVAEEVDENAPKAVAPF